MRIFAELRLPYGFSFIFSCGLKMVVGEEVIDHRRQNLTDAVIRHGVENLFPSPL